MDRKLWLDDIRPSPDDSWDAVTTADAAISSLTFGNYETASLDHDLGDVPGVGTGLDVVRFIVSMPKEKRPLRVWVHSMNPVGAMNMRAVLKDGGYPWA